MQCVRSKLSRRFSLVHWEAIPGHNVCQSVVEDEHTLMDSDVCKVTCRKCKQLLLDLLNLNKLRMPGVDYLNALFKLS
ncbi:hypothetical protein ES705_11339 [subsurface metagenome]